jgi:ABC-type multidrug transport system ATPase subunit
VLCFFLSGINGAGKTTTMKMMTGDVAMSKGRAYINGYSVVKQLPMVRKEIGYCPQFDPLIGQCRPLLVFLYCSHCKSVRPMLTVFVLLLFVW